MSGVKSFHFIKQPTDVAIRLYLFKFLVNQFCFSISLAKICSINTLTPLVDKKLNIIKYVSGMLKQQKPTDIDALFFKNHLKHLS